MRVRLSSAQGGAKTKSFILTAAAMTTSSTTTEAAASTAAATTSQHNAAIPAFVVLDTPLPRKDSFGLSLFSPTLPEAVPSPHSTGVPPSEIVSSDGSVTSTSSNYSSDIDELKLLTKGDFGITQMGKFESLAKRLHVESLADTVTTPTTNNNFFSSVSSTSRAQIIGHRGAPYHELENTLQSFRTSADIGCDAVELDVFRLKCGTLVVFHGSGGDSHPGMLPEYCGVDGSILDLTYEEARQLTFNPTNPEFVCGPNKIQSTPYYIPKLEEVLLDVQKYNPSMIVKIELKGPGTADPTLALVEKLGMVDRCHYSSFDHSQIARIRELRPQRNLVDGTYQYKTGALFSSNLPEDFIEQCVNIGASEVHLKYDTCTKERIDAIHEAGMDTMAWFRGPIGMRKDMEVYGDVGNEDEDMYRTVMATGVRMMCVNRPDVLARMMMPKDEVLLHDNDHHSKDVMMEIAAVV